MLNLVKPKKNKKGRMLERYKETKKDIEEMKVGCRFYEGAVDVPDVRFSVGSMLEARYTRECGFPKAKQIQLDPPLSHRHIELHTTTQREGEPGFSCSCGKKEGTGEGRMSGGNPSHRGGPLVGPKSYYSLS